MGRQSQGHPVESADPLKQTNLSDLPAGAKRPFRVAESLRSALHLVGNRQRFTFAWLIVARVAVGICDLLLAGSMYFLFLLLQGAPPTHHLWWTPKTTLSAALTTSALVVLRTLMDISSTRAVVSHIQRLYTEILLRLTTGYNEMQWSRFVERNRSELLNHAMYSAREAANFYHLVIEMITSIVVVLVMTVALVYQNPAAACGLGVAVLLFYVIHRFFIRTKLQKAVSEREQSLRVLQRSLADMFSSGKEIRSYGIESFFQNRIGKQARDVAAGHLQVVLLPQIARILADQGVVLLFLFIVVAVQLRNGDTRQLLSLLVFYFVLSRRLLPLISQISFMAGQMESSYKNVQVVAYEFNDCMLHRMVAPTMQLPDEDLVIEIDRVSFSFHEDVPILRNVSLYMRRGETVVLHGVSGSGKSSLLNIVAGVLQPNSGDVRVDRANIAYVPQDIALLDDSIRNNLLFGLAAKSDAELMSALAIARLDEFVAAQPQGLDTGVGDNGALFSGGQRQRLGLARAILRGSRLLLLDEATSALDEENESRILESLSTSGMAVLLVTHRAHRRAYAQRVFRLQQGRLIEEPVSELSPEHAYIGTKK
ncbi:ABC transporter ATP-binding protein [Acidicapsa ligni]|uniref:ABC transporter ATP-binding protein n=1 Tax=Acidicapsa ligni TaxID=542300 RepID=UPI0021E06872|nr:ABC transporter ATP-binding protein [Acidicapsa ligni]